MIWDMTAGRLPLVLLVDRSLASRHRMWRALARGFGVLEAANARGAREWMARRPEIEALIVDHELPDERGLEFVGSLARAEHRLASRAIVLTGASGKGTPAQHAAVTLVERGDLRAVLSQLAAWLSPQDRSRARAPHRDAHRTS